MKLSTSIVLITLVAGALPVLADDDYIFTPTNPPELTPLRSHHTPAYKAAKLFQHGVNLGDYLESGRWNGNIPADDFVEMKRQGFDHVRIPVGWQHHAGPAPDYTLSPEIFSRVDFAVTNVLKNKMAAIINIHHFDELDKDPAGTTPEFPGHLAANRGALSGLSPATGV
jgi:hypothetical protein